MLETPDGTLIAISVSLSIVKLAFTPLKSTVVVVAKLLPLSVISVFIGPLEGLNVLMIGAGQVVLSAL
nr:hypothetical protein [Winogradskyella psychrotolerans]